jgi:MFS family permease
MFKFGPIHRKSKNIVSSTGLIVFRYREYRFFWIAAAFSNIGMWALIYATLWLMHELTASPLLVGLVSTANLGPVLAFSMMGGVIADRKNRLVILRWTRGMFSVSAVLMGVLIAVDQVQAWHVFIISIANGVLLAFDSPARAAMLPALVPKEHLASAIVLYALVFGGAGIIGPAFLSPMVSLWGLGSIFFLVAVAYSLTLVTLMAMDSTNHASRDRAETIVQGMAQGLVFLWDHRIILGVISLGVIAGIFGDSIAAVLPFYTDTVLLGEIDSYSKLLFALGIGGLVATISIILVSSKLRPPLFFIGAGISYGMGILALSRMSGLFGAGVSVGLIGASQGVFKTMAVTLVQANSSDEFRGRMMSVEQLSWGATALGGLTMGGMTEAWGIGPALSIGGTVLLASTSVLATMFLRERILMTKTGS